jgi:hypothetical protein
MLCDRDRNVTYIPKTQPGFIAFATLPLISALNKIVPSTLIIKERLLKNKEEWEQRGDQWEPTTVYDSKAKGLLPLEQKLW